MPIKLLRLDCEVSRPNSLEHRLAKDAGIDEFFEISGYQPQEILSIQPDFILIVSGYLHRQTILELGRCKAIMRMGNGFDKIDVAAASEKGILVTNVPDFCEHEMAEHSMAMLLASARRLVQMHQSMQNGSFFEYRQNTALHRVHGSTLGLIGFGSTARRVAEIAHAMGMRIITYHRHIVPGVEAAYHATPVALDKLLMNSDYLMIACPLTDETRNMIGIREINLMKKDAVIINTARGAICNEAALTQALRDKKIAYAAIDVYEHIDVFNKAGKFACLYNGLDNVLLTPHIGGSSVEAGIDKIKTVYEQVKMVIDGELPRHCVNSDIYGTRI